MDNENMETTVAEKPNPSEMLLSDLMQSDMPPQQETPASAETESPAEAQETAETPAVDNVIPSSEEMLNSIIQGSKTGENPAQAAPEAHEETEEVPKESPEEEIDFNSDEFLNEFYEDPAAAVQKAADKIADKKVKQVVSELEQRLKPLLSQSEEAQLRDEVKGVMGDFLNEVGDAKEMLPDIAEYIKANNLDPKDRRSYMDAYRESKIGRQGREIEQLKASQGRNLGDYLSDEASLAEIANNDSVKQKVIEEYLKGLQQGGKPATIGNRGNNQASASPVNSPKTIKEASAMLKDQLGQVM